MWKTLCRNGALALVVLIGTAGWSQAQYYPSRWGQNPSLTLQGTWFSNGDPLRPCHIDVAPGGIRNANLIFLDEVGNRANGRLLDRGVVVTANGFMGQVSGDVISWSDGSYWTR